jgi:hypothetical protein
LALEEIDEGNTMWKSFNRQVLSYYRFVSSLRRKKHDYLLEMKSETILSLFLKENFPRENILWGSNCINWEIFEKFNICNIYWDKNAISNTTKSRGCLWDKLLNLHTKFISKSKSINGKLKLRYFRELKDKLGPELTTKFVDLAISNLNDKFILDFQEKIC